MRIDLRVRVQTFDRNQLASTCVHFATYCLQFSSYPSFKLTAFFLFQCFTVSDLYRYFKFDTGSVLNETNFKRVSPAIVYHLLLPEKNPGSSRAVCRSSTLPENLFAAFAANFSGLNAGITLEALDEVLENVNETLGEILTKKKVRFD